MRALDQTGARPGSWPQQHLGAPDRAAPPDPPGPCDRQQQSLFPTYEYHPFITDRNGDAASLTSSSGAREVELAIATWSTGWAWTTCPDKASRPTTPGSSCRPSRTTWALNRPARRPGRHRAPDHQDRAQALPDRPRRLTTHARQQHLRLPAHCPWIRAGSTPYTAPGTTRPRQLTQDWTVPAFVDQH